MEIAVLQKSTLRIKGKHATLVVNPSDKAAPFEGALFYEKPKTQPKDAGLTIYGPGEYELAGIKITGVRNGERNTAFSITIDGITLLTGAIETLDALQTKMKEHNLVIASISIDVDASFITNLATNAVVVYGEKAEDVMQTFAKEEIKKLPKYVITKDKLPAEIETVLLA